MEDLDDALIISEVKQTISLLTPLPPAQKIEEKKRRKKKKQILSFFFKM